LAHCKLLTSAFLSDLWLYGKSLSNVDLSHLGFKREDFAMVASLMPDLKIQGRGLGDDVL